MPKLTDNRRIRARVEKTVFGKGPLVLGSGENRDASLGQREGGGENRSGNGAHQGALRSDVDRIGEERIESTQVSRSPIS
jgi:hypothetical protein